MEKEVRKISEKVALPEKKPSRGGVRAEAPPACCMMCPLTGGSVTLMQKGQQCETCTTMDCFNRAQIDSEKKTFGFSPTEKKLKPRKRRRML